MRRLLGALLLTAGLIAGPCLGQARAAEAGAQRFLLLVSGLGGETFYSELFRRWSQNLLDVARQGYGLSAGQVIHLAESLQPPDGVEAETADGLADRDSVLAAIAAIAERSAPDDRVLLVLIGHGTAQGARARFNLPGPDLTPDDLAEALQALDGRRVAVVNTAPASAGFLRPLSGPQRVVITATANAAENQHTRFGGYFIEALGAEAADADKDRRVSLLEAFDYANRQLEQAYRSESRLRVEHAQLDDNGDAEGSREPARDGAADGALAARFDLAALDPGPTGAAGLPLQLEARRLVDAIERLKRERNLFSDEQYDARLESLLVELAVNRRAYREAVR